MEHIQGQAGVLAMVTCLLPSGSKGVGPAVRTPEFSALVRVYCVCVPEQLAVRSLLQSPLPAVPSASVTCPFPAPGAASLEKHNEQTEQSSWEPKVSYFSAAQTSPLFLNPLTTSLSVFLLLLLRIPTSSSMTGP